MRLQKTGEADRFNGSVVSEMPRMERRHHDPEDAAVDRLMELGYSAGRVATKGPGGVAWTVAATKGEHRITTHAATLAGPYRAAIEQTK